MTSSERVPPRLLARIEAKLDDGEKITWVGTPIAWRFAMRAVPTALKGILFITFAFVWMAGTGASLSVDFAEHARVFQVVQWIGIPVSFIGFGMLCSPLWMIHKAKKTTYVLTTARAIIFDRACLGVRIRSFGPEHIAVLRQKQRSDGSGDLIFERKRTYDKEDNESHYTNYGFLAIADVESVEKLVCRVAGASSSNKA